MTPKKYAIIVAAGSGSRFGSDLPKQFVALDPDGTPVLMHTVRAFVEAGFAVEDIRVVLSADMRDFWGDMCSKFGFDTPPVVSGGKVRFESVKNALATLPTAPGDRILVHDGARPLVSRGVIERVARSPHTAVIPVTAMADSLRRVHGDGSHPVDRREYVAVQTPQGFDAEVLKTAYRREYDERFTDDASVVEAAGHRITLVEGDPTNIKITVGADLALAKALLATRR